MLVYILSKFITIVFGMMYPAYASYKTIKAKDAKGYVQWMMYWIVFAVYSIVEIFLDAFCACWFPFYYELKILFMFWMLSPTTRGGSTLYRTFIHPALTKHENEIDSYVADAKLRTGNMVTNWGSRALSYVSDSFVRIILRTPNLAVDYLESRQRQGRMIGDQEYDGNQNQGHEIGYHRPRNWDFRNGYGDRTDGTRRRYADSYESDDLNEDSAMQADPTFIPPSGLRKDAKVLSKKTKTEFGNFSMVTAQDGSMNNKPIIFGWYPYSETPTMFSPDISTGIIPSVLPTVLPTMPFLGTQEAPVSSSSSRSKPDDLTVSPKPVDPVDTSHSDEFVDSITTPTEEHSVDDFFDCEEVEKKAEVKGTDGAGNSKPNVSAVSKQPNASAANKQPNVSANIKVVGKTNLQTFDKKPSGTLAAKTSVDNLVRHSSSESLASVKRKTASLTSLSKLDKTKARKSFSGTESKPKVALFSSQSFRRVLHPFVSSKPLTSSHSSKNVSRSSTSVDAKKDVSAPNSDK